MEIKNIGLSTGSSNATSENRGVLSSSNQNISVSGQGVNSSLADLAKGSVFAGDIIDVRSTAIKILLSDNQTVQAKASNSTELNIGDHINFRVEENDGKSIMIKALNINNRYTSPLTQALESANIPVNERNMQMINEMMHNEMPIDKTSVYDMYKIASAFEEFDVINIVDMVRHDIDVNEKNLTQFEKYVNYEHRISNEVDTIADDIVDMLKFTATQNELQSENIIKDFTRNLIDILPESTFVAKENESIIDFTVGDNINLNEIISLESEDKIEEMNNLLRDNLDNISEDDSENIINGNLNNSDKADEVMDKVRQSFLEASDSKAVDKNLLKDIINTLDNKKLNELFSSDEFRKYIRKSFSKNFKIDLNSLKSDKADGEELKETIKSIYEKMDSKTDKLLDMSKSLSDNANKLRNDISNLKDNLSFMNELNSMASYVQLPLITSNGENHGELYVFNKHRNKTISDDEVTAAMHLDMDHLGTTDCFIRLQNDNKLSTNFTLADDLSYKIVEEHLDELKERLNKLGFDVSVSLSHEQKEQNPLDIIMEADKPKISIKRYSFDVRA